MSKLVGTKIAKVHVGVGGDNPPAYGLVNSMTVKEAAEVEKVKNGAGDTIGKIVTDQRKEVSMELTMLTETSPSGPNQANPVGEKLTVEVTAGETIDITIDSVDKKYESGKAATVSVSGEHNPNLEFTA